MIRTLLIIAGAALVLAIASLGGAAALGGADLRKNGWSWTIWDDGQDHIRWKRERGGPQDLGPDTSRTMAWSGGDRLDVELPVNVEYRQGAAANVIVTGPKALIDQIVVENGRVGWANGEQDGERVTVTWSKDGFRAMTALDRVKVVVTAPNVSRFNLDGSGDLDIRDYDQESLAIDIQGSGDVFAEGRARALSLDISGSGEADLANLQAADADVDVTGSGEARVSATGVANVSIAGSGDIDLVTRPTTLRQSVTGSGDINVSGG